MIRELRHSSIMQENTQLNQGKCVCVCVASQCTYTCVMCGHKSFNSKCAVCVFLNIMLLTLSPCCINYDGFVCVFKAGRRLMIKY